MPSILMKEKGWQNMALKFQDLVEKGQIEDLVAGWEMVSGLQAVVISEDERLIYAKEPSSAHSVLENERANSFDIIVNGEKLGTAVVYKRDYSWEDELIQAARNAGADEFSFSESLRAMELLSEERTQRAKHILKESINGLLQGIHTAKSYHGVVERLSSGIEETHSLVKEIRRSTNDLKSIQSRQKILALNANIEAARAGEHGKGFGVVADEVGRLSDNSNAVNEKISSVVKRISEVVGGLSIDEDK